MAAGCWPYWAKALHMTLSSTVQPPGPLTTESKATDRLGRCKTHQILFGSFFSLGLFHGLRLKTAFQIKQKHSGRTNTIMHKESQVPK